MYCVKVALLVVLTICLMQQETSASINLHKRSFSTLGCMGEYDKSKLARLNRLCEECFQMFREPEIHMSCRRDCFQNEIFDMCVTALSQEGDRGMLRGLVKDLYGKRSME